MKKIISFCFATVFACGLFFYLTGTTLIWRAVLAGLLGISLYNLTYGFIKYGR